MSFSRPLRRRLSMESLESRCMLSATPDVTVKLVNGTLLLNGNKANCDVDVNGTGTPGQYTITGFDGTQITYLNSTSTSKTVNGVSGGINVKLPGAGGFEAVGLSNATVAGSVNINMGPGEDIVGIGRSDVFNRAGPLTVDGNLNINTGRGVSEVFESAVTVRQNENINLGPGFRVIELDVREQGRVTVFHDFNINAIGSGETAILISETPEVPEIRVPTQDLAPIGELNVGNDFNINIGGGTLHAVLRDMIVGNNFNLTSAAGNTALTVTGAIVGQNANITTGKGADIVRLDEFSSKTLNVSLGSNRDRLTLIDTTTTIATNLDGGPGTDTLSYLAGGNSLAMLKIFNFEVIS